MATVHEVLRLPVQDIADCPVVQPGDVPAIEAAVDSLLAKCLYCIRVQRAYPLEVLLSMLLQCTLSRHSQLGVAMVQRDCAVPASVARVVLSGTTRARLASTSTNNNKTNDNNTNSKIDKNDDDGVDTAHAATHDDDDDDDDAHDAAVCMSCVDALCGITAALLSRTHRALRRDVDVTVFVDLLQRLCTDVTLKERLGAAHMGSVLVDFLYDDAQHRDDYRLARGCASALIALLRGSRANKSRVAALASRVAACVQRSCDVYLQMQCVEVLFRLHTAAPTLLSTPTLTTTTAMDESLRRGIAALPNDATLLLRMQDVVDAYNAVHHAHDVLAFTAVRITAAGGAAVCGPTRLYFSPLLLVALLPGSVDEHSASGDDDCGGSDNNNNNTGFTVPYEHIRSVKLTRERVLLLRLHVVPDELSSRLQPREGYDTLHVYFTPSSLAALRASNVHAWIASRKRTHAARAVVAAAPPSLSSLPPTGQGVRDDADAHTTRDTHEQQQQQPQQRLLQSSSSSSTARADDDAHSPRERSDGHTAPPSPLSSSSTSLLQQQQQQQHTLPPPHGAPDMLRRQQPQQQQRERSRMIECARYDDDNEEGDYARVQQQQSQQHAPPPPPQQPPLLDAVHHAAAVKARRLHEQQLSTLRDAAQRVHEELATLQRGNTHAREALQRVCAADTARIRDAEAALKRSAADHVTQLNEELAHVQTLGAALQSEAEALRTRLRDAVAAAAGVEATRLLQVKRLVDAQMQDMHHTLYALLDDRVAAHELANYNNDNDNSYNNSNRHNSDNNNDKSAAVVACGASSHATAQSHSAMGYGSAGRPQPKARRLDFS